MQTNTAISRSGAVIAMGLLLATSLAAEPTPDAVTVVEAFNAAISAGDTEAAKRHLTPGGVQFTLRSMHDGVGPAELTTALSDHWAMILPVIFSSTENYTRTVEILNAESFGDIATVWTRTTTVSQRRGGSDAQSSEFTEVYMLVATPDGWKVASIADNRPSSSLATP
ncbi:MAG: hypothetical protein V2J12_12595 [Gammaproteobacteria bacterium]|jgi:ketosteroid isomerase-like protein|nr:hypothetical protein [Gammaproteobacteria bacterium]